MLGQEPAGPFPDEGSLTHSARPTARTAVGVLAVAFLLGGCATGADVAGLATQDEVLKLRTDVTSLQRSVQQTRAQTEALSGQLTTRPAAPVNDATPQVDAINQRLDTITGTLTVLTRRVDDLSGRLDALGRQVRASAIRPGPGGMPVPGPLPPAPPPATAAPASPGASTAAPVTAAPLTAAPVVPAPATAAPARPSPPTAGPAAPPAAATPAPSAARSTLGALPPQDLYQASYIDFSKGNYTQAIDGFREFLRRYPDHAQASNAQYWIGEGYVALAQQQSNAGQPERATETLQRAVQEFRKVVANYPRGDRAPTALYKEALTLVELKQPALAQARLQYLVDNFPQAEEIPLARERLAALKR
jgi:tol-pal system protein YbgF